MTTSYLRHLTALGVGATLTLGLVSACATPHTIDGYITEVRGQLADYDNRSTSDDQIVNIGRSTCSYPESFNMIGSTENDATPEQQEQTDAFLKTTQDYCDVLGANPMTVNETDAYTGGPYMGDAAAAAPVTPLPPAPIVIGEPIAINYGGTENVMTYTVNSVGRCGGSLRLDVTVKTGSVFSTNDSLTQTADYVDTEGVTHTSLSSISTDYNCYEGALPSGYEMKPDRTYTGHVSFEIPSGTGTTLSLYGTDGVTRTLDITGK